MRGYKKLLLDVVILLKKIREVLRMAKSSDKGKAEVKSSNTSTTKKIHVVGPVETNMADVLRFNRDKNRKAIDLVPDTFLTIGDEDGTDLTEAEGQRLLNIRSWEVKEVTE